jgi:glyoxylase-like metal-dependent hydrolase (beta-lactamase superfamily II)
MSSEQFIAFMNIKVNPDPRIALPVVTFASDVTFHLNGEEIVVRHVPRAHTDGDAIVHFRNADVVHMGDVFFNRMYPFIDASTGGTLDGTIAGTDRGLELAGPNTKIIPGHGPLATKADLQAYRDMLATVAARIKEAKRAGKTMEETIAAKPTAEFDPVFGKGFLPADKWVEMLWKGAT